MLRSARELIKFRISGTDGEVGQVHDFYFDDELWAVRYLVVDTGGWLGGRLVLIAPFAIELPRWEEAILPLLLTKAQIEASPDIDLAKPVSRQQEIDLHEYYGWPAYWAGSPMLGTGTVQAYPAVLKAAEDVEASLRDEQPPVERYRGDPNLRSTRELLGYRIQAVDGEIGRLHDLFLNEQSWMIGYAMVDTGGWLTGKDVMIPPQALERISWPEQTVYVNLTRQKVEESPEYKRGPYLADDAESILSSYYGYPRYPG